MMQYVRQILINTVVFLGKYLAEGLGNIVPVKILLSWELKN
jgi:hypothetical protein